MPPSPPPRRAPAGRNAVPQPTILSPSRTQKPQEIGSLQELVMYPTIMPSQSPSPVGRVTVIDAQAVRSRHTGPLLGGAVGGGGPAVAVPAAHETQAVPQAAIAAVSVAWHSLLAGQRYGVPEGQQPPGQA